MTQSAPNDSHTQARPGIDSGDPTDGRKAYDWDTRYPRQAVVRIRWEAAYLIFLLLSSHFLIFVTWIGWLHSFIGVQGENVFTLKKYAYYGLSGLLGGVAFGIKYFYRVVARGFWHRDRIIWRLMSPYMSMTLALIIGTLIDSSFITTRGPNSGPAIVSIGFMVGYFADKAIAKMYEIANVVFGTSVSTKSEDGK